MTEAKKITTVAKSNPATIFFRSATPRRAAGLRGFRRGSILEDRNFYYGAYMMERTACSTGVWRRPGRRLRRYQRKILSWLTLRGEPSALRHRARDSHTARRRAFRSPVHQLAERLSTAEHARSDRPDRHVEDRRGLLIRCPLQTDQQYHPALLLGNASESTIEIAQRQPPYRIGCRCGERPLIVELDGNAFAHAAPDAVYILVVHYREEPSVEIATVLPAMLLRYRADESVLDEIIGPEHITSQRAGIASQARDFFFEKPPEIVHLSRLCSWQST